MPFNRDGVWTQPVEADHADFHARIMSKPNEIAPTREMIDAIAANLPVDEPTVHNDMFNTIGKLEGAVDIVIPV